MCERHSQREVGHIRILCITMGIYTHLKLDCCVGFNERCYFRGLQQLPQYLPTRTFRD